MVIIKDLEKHYGSFHLNVSMEIPDGRITGMIGKNGAGKTTTIKAILDLIRPDGGSVEVFGKDIKDLTHTEKERISAALAESGFSGWLYVEDAVKILRSLYSRFDEGMFREYCRILNLPLKKPIKEFSMGMKAKLRVLCALCTGADLMIMDEPTAGLDVEARIEILELIQKYMEAHPDASVLISSHISSDLEGLCDDIYLIHDGKILLHEDTDVILDNYGVLK
ncbi:MAG: ABC transporter ATP-binding protein, partial [Solobacterium sp.]|nr:ABC transporter ATP-binding protein [Solobacterium sp.]